MNMNAPPPPIADATVEAAADAAAAPCPRCERDAERQARYSQVLGWLVEMGMKAAAAVERRTEAEAAAAELVLAKAAAGEISAEQLAAKPSGAKAAADIALAFSRLSRSIRLTLLLEDKLIENFRKREKEDAKERAEQAAAAHEERRKRTRSRTKRLVTDAICAETGDQSEADRLFKWLDERIDDADIVEDLSTRSAAELTERICTELELFPDWDRWKSEGLLDDPGTAEKTQACPVCSRGNGAETEPEDRPPDPPGTDPP
jgi:hypothetical protein